MPLPILIAGLAAGAAALGISAQSDAKKSNEKANELIYDAEDIYYGAKRSLERAQNKTEDSLLKLGNSKKHVLETSLTQFVSSYEKIKHIELSESIGLDEIRNFTFEKQDILEVKELADIYKSTLSSSATGAAAGAIVALAANGTLPFVTGMFSTAGAALLAGEVSAAAGIAGSALSLGASMTPLAAIAAPALLFSGISASVEADKNLEIARAQYKKAQVAAEKMKTAETLCYAISERADLYHDLLGELNELFSYCASVLENVIARHTKNRFNKKNVDARTLTEEELKLVAVTRALAGAVKAVIDTSLLNDSGGLSLESQDVYNDTVKNLPAFNQSVEMIKEVDYEQIISNKRIRKTTENICKDTNVTKKISYKSKILPIILILILCLLFVYGIRFFNKHNATLKNFNSSVIIQSGTIDNSMEDSEISLSLIDMKPLEDIDDSANSNGVTVKNSINFAYLPIANNSINATNNTNNSEEQYFEQAKINSAVEIKPVTIPTFGDAAMNEYLISVNPDASYEAGNKNGTLWHLYWYDIDKTKEINAFFKENFDYNKTDVTSADINSKECFTRIEISVPKDPTLLPNYCVELFWNGTLTVNHYYYK